MQNNQQLYHFGIPGQKWGVRRYQNEDRTWTDEGKIRYGDGTVGRTTDSEDHKNAHSGKRMSEMSTKELQAHNQRMEAQKKYRSFHPSTVEKGLKVVVAAAAALGTVAAFKGNFKNVFGIGFGQAVKKGARACNRHGFVLVK